MDVPETTAAQPNVPPNIRRAPGLTLTPVEESLLARAFADSQEIFVEREFRSGYSGAVVLLVSLGSGQAQVVVKLGSPVELQQEYAAYQQFVKQASPQNTARLQGEPLLTTDEQLALLSYTFAGGDPRLPTHSLQAYYESKGGQATAAVLDRVFRVYGRQWWAINRPQKFVVSEQYDRLLPVHLKLKPAETVETNPRTLVAGQINAAALRDLRSGQPVRLQGFHVAETRPDREEVKLTANPPPGEASAPLRLRLETDEAMAYRPGERLETLDAVITATRQTILPEAASSALPALDPEAIQFTLNGDTYPNPLFNLPDLLDRVIETKVSTIHGDLNLQNILVDEETGFAWLIDFAETRRGPTLFDLQRLESQVITKLLPPVIAQAGLEPVVVADLLESLHADPPTPTAPHPALQEPYTVLVAIRRLARQYLMDDRDWDEYYLGLVITLVGSLKYPELEPVGRQLALIAAAVAQELMGKPIATATLTPASSRPVSIQGRGGVAMVESLAAQPSIGQQIANFFTGISEQQRDLRNRQIMLQRVHDFWVKGVLENSLHNEVLIKLGMETKTEAVKFPWDMIIQPPNQPNHILPPGTKIIDVFDESGGSLLILGEPGSGKTTMLLELARQLIARTEVNSTQPMPVVFNLSSWGQRQLPLDEWLVEELNSKYNIPKKVGRLWVANNELLLLLDGLDEVDQDYLLSCLDAINAFHKDSFAPIVVSSRTSEYESLSGRINFQQAIVLRELTSQQIEAYLAQLPYDFLALRKILQKDLSLQELARTPLMLSIMTLIYGGSDPDELPSQDSSGIQRRRLFEEYVQQMFERRGTNETYRKDRTLHWLAWLARNMKVHTQTVFLIESLQPVWLSERLWRIAYIFSSRFIISLMIALIVGLFLGLIDQLSDGLVLEVIVITSGGGDKIPTEFYEPIGGLWEGLKFGFNFGLFAGLIIGLEEIARLETTVKPSKRRGIINLVVVVIGLSSLSICFVILLSWVPQTTLFSPKDIITFTLMGWMILGLLYVAIFGFRGRNQSLVTDIRTVELLGWSWSKGFRGALVGVGLVIIMGLLLGIIGAQRGQVPDEIRVMLVALSFWGPLGGLIGFLFGGLSSQMLETKTTAGIGIKLSARNGVYAGLLIASLGGIAGALGGTLPFGLTGWLPFGLSAGLSYGICFGLLAFLWYGGFDLIQHYTLRLILITQGHTPRNYVRFLDYATKRIFLRKVGGGYIFVHRQLMEHFAEMELE